MARDIDGKLRLTAAVLGTITRKDLAAAFRRVNPATSFDVERASKWLQGRAKPREQQLYEDWVRLLDLGRRGDWLANCELDVFIEALSQRFGTGVDELRRASRREASRLEERAGPEGLYACYSHAWSPYFAGRLLRGTMLFARAAPPSQPTATYVEALPTGPLRLTGPASEGHFLHLDLRQPDGDARLLFGLFPPRAPFSVLGGHLSGATILGPEALPAVSRIVLVRLPSADAAVAELDAYLPPEASIAGDLAALGLPSDEPGKTDRLLQTFLTPPPARFDHIPSANYHALIDHFDLTWLRQLAAAPSGS